MPHVSPFALLDVNSSYLQQTEQLRHQIDRLQPHLPPRTLYHMPTAVTMEHWIIYTVHHTAGLQELYRAAVRGLVLCGAV